MATDDCVGATGLNSEECYQYECDTCKLDGITKQAVVFCPECGEKLCESCEVWHKKIRASRDHNVIPVSEMASVTHKDAKTAEIYKAVCSCSRQNEVDEFCEDHRELVCSMCSRIKHKDCHVQSIEKLSLEESLTGDFNDVSDNIDQLIALAMKLKTDNAANKLQLNESKENCRSKIKDFSASLHAWIDELEVTALRRLDEDVACPSSELNKTDCDIESTLELLQADKQLIDSAKQTQIKSQMFIMKTKIQNELDTYKNVLDEIFSKRNIPTASFEANKNLSNFKTEIKCIGEMKMNDIRQKTHCRSKSFLDIQVKKIKRVNIKNADDNQSPAITGIAVLNEGKFIVSDYDNYRLTLLDEAFNIQDTMECLFHPWDVAQVDNNEVVVTFPTDKKLQYFTLASTIKAGKTIQLSSQMYGITVLADNIYLAGFLTDVQILDKAGNLVRIIACSKHDTAGLTLSSQCFVARNRAENRVYISNANQDALFCISLEG